MQREWKSTLSLNAEGVEIHSLVVTLRITPCGVDPLQLGNGLTFSLLRVDSTTSLSVDSTPKMK